MITFKKLAGIVALAAFASPAWAFTVGGTDVGSADTFLGQTTNLQSGACAGVGNGSNPTSEVCFLNSVAGTSYTTTDYIKEEDVSYVFVDGSNTVFAFALPDEPAHFIIKNSTWWAAFANVSEFDWAVINSALLDAGFNIGSVCTVDNPCTLSHIGYAGDGPGEDVPEPGSLALLGLGLLGLGLSRRRARA